MLESLTKRRNPGRGWRNAAMSLADICKEPRPAEERPCFVGNVGFPSREGCEHPWTAWGIGVGSFRVARPSSGAWAPLHLPRGPGQESAVGVLGGVKTPVHGAGGIPCWEGGEGLGWFACLAADRGCLSGRVRREGEPELFQQRLRGRGAAMPKDGRAAWQMPLAQNQREAAFCRERVQKNQTHGNTSINNYGDVFFSKC